MQVIRLELHDILSKHLGEESTAQIERRIENVIVEAVNASQTQTKEHSMEKYLTKEAFHEKENAIVAAIHELRLDLNKQMNLQAWRIIGALGTLMALLKYLPNIL